MIHLEMSQAYMQNNKLLKQLFKKMSNMVDSFHFKESPPNTLMILLETGRTSREE